MSASPTPPLPRLLIVDDEEVARDGLAMALEDSYQIETAAHGKEALELFDKGDFQALITDLRMPQMGGLELLSEVRERSQDVVVLMVTGYAAIDSAVEAMRLGADDYVPKPYHLDDVRIRLQRSLERRGLIRQNRALREAAARSGRGTPILGTSASIDGVRKTVRKVAKAQSPVLVTGESGTGKELVARELHRQRAPEAPFLSLNCGAIPPELVASELFGAKKGAFTGAHQDRPGIFEAAQGGTVFLDEIGEIESSTQVALLRVLQEQEVTPLGATQPLSVSFRLVAATHRDLKQGVEDGTFRQDLYYRICVLEISLPPLRRRPEDIPLLAETFLQRIATREARPAKALSPRTLELLSLYPWPGNIRELQNILDRCFLLSPGKTIQPSDLPREIQELAPHPEDLETLAEVEAAHIQKVLDRVSGNRTRAAKILGLDRSSLWRRLKDGEPEPEAESEDPAG